MSNKQQLQLNNETLGSILSNVLGLPSQESLKQGVYVWKKYQYTPPTYETSLINAPDLTIRMYGGVGNVSSNIGIEKTSVDSSLTLDTMPLFLDGYSFVSNDGKIYTFNLSEGGILKLNSSVVFVTEATNYWVITPVSITFPSSNTITATYPSDEKETKKIITPAARNFECFLTSDSYDAYPDYGADGMYWYQKLGDITPIAFGCTKMAVDKIVLASDSQTVQHSLGEIPVIVIFSADTLLANGIVHGIASFVTLYGSYNMWCEKLSNNSHTPHESSCDATDSTFTISSSDLHFATGVKYTLITMA